MVAGDLNARIGSLQDGIEFIPGLDWYIPDNFAIPRNAKDRVVTILVTHF